MATSIQRKLTYLGAWALLAVYFTTWDVLLYHESLFRGLLLNGCQTLVWALEGLIIIRVAHWCPIEGLSFRFAKAWIINLGTGFLLAVLGLGIAWLISLGFQHLYQKSPMPAWSHAKMWSSMLRFYGTYFHTVLLIMWTMLGIYHFQLLNRRVRRQQVETAQLAASLAQAQHSALQAQLQPHFLFNTLNSISAMIQDEPEAAERMVARLADFLRLTLDTPPTHLVALREEFAATEVYLAIEQVRFQDRLKVTLTLPPDLGACQVPSFILQPLVENALKHGLATRARGGILTLTAEQEGPWLQLVVQDDGAGFEGRREGIGLSNVRSRLRLLYGDEQKVEIFSVRDKGTRVILRIPKAFKGRALDLSLPGGG